MRERTHTGGTSATLALRFPSGRTVWGIPSGRTVRGTLLAVTAAALLLLASGCLAKSGNYAPIDWAAEMHYTQTYRPQEPPRLDSPPGAVPYKFAGDERTLTREPFVDPQDYTDLVNPRAGEAAAGTPGHTEAAELYRWNCSHCHGMEGAGDGRVNDFLTAYSYVPVPDLSDEATVEKTDGDIYGILKDGVLVMPAFGNLLPPEDRWLLVDYVRELQGR